MTVTRPRVRERRSRSRPVAASPFAQESARKLRAEPRTAFNAAASDHVTLKAADPAQPFVTVPGGATTTISGVTIDGAEVCAGSPAIARVPLEFCSGLD